MKDLLFKKIDIVFWTMRGTIILCAQCILRRWRQMVALSELLHLFL